MADDFADAMARLGFYSVADEPAVTEKTVSKFEKAIGQILPEDYRNFLLHHGMVAASNLVFPDPDRPGKPGLQHFSGPQLVLHSAHDHLVDRSHAERLHAWAGSGDKQLVIFPNGNHNTILHANYLEYVLEVAQLLRRVGVLAGPGGSRPAPAT